MFYTFKRNLEFGVYSITKHLTEKHAMGKQKGNIKKYVRITS